MSQRNRNSIVVQPVENSAAVEYLGFSLLSLPSKYPPMVRSQRKRQLRLIRETRRRFPLRGRTKFTVHSATPSVAGDDNRRG